jgi:hypothetical protein
LKEASTRSERRIVRTFVSTITPPTSEPSTRPGMCRTSHAAIGAAISPPISRARTAVNGMPEAPMPIRNPMLAATDTKNSDVSTEPTTFRGSIRPLASSAGVATGPQPPPPVESMNPANTPSGARKRLRTGLPSWPRGVPHPVNRMRM